jgi:hypothetical protein
MSWVEVLRTRLTKAGDSFIPTALCATAQCYARLGNDPSIGINHSRALGQGRHSNRPVAKQSEHGCAR